MVIKAAYNEDPIARLIGPANESVVTINDSEENTLVDSGAQISAICLSLVKKLKLPIYQLEQIIRIEGTGGGAVPYLGFTEVNLKIPGMPTFNEDTLFLVLPDSYYTDRVPMQLGTKHIDRILEIGTPEEIANLSKAWERGTVGRTIHQKGSGPDHTQST